MVALTPCSSPLPTNPCGVTGSKNGPALPCNIGDMDIGTLGWSMRQPTRLTLSWEDYLGKEEAYADAHPYIQTPGEIHEKSEDRPSTHWLRPRESTPIQCVRYALRKRLTSSTVESQSRTDLTRK
ncbi:uncharacterized protein BHQ10_002353 [Talaromyces amestolkiae]|uniref:Uncharacterized protein n=1 Tax=Talaromyces amestolkiae TaxID=1196081 RepID=A0A364KS61_TALAM|nr:uncharacterized protein BHQ10_002353 [Talaromyces amestolkiae]RAO66341.1 hypothetical protein BHQ10_002353 [Talaromyces amestolkiae]